MSAAGSNFPGVNYNDMKIKKGKGELVVIKNFPSFITGSSKKEEIRNYLKTISNNNANVKKPQFHAMISTKFQKHSKEELSNVAEKFMEGMGYGKQPYIVVFHSDTDHNHVHLVTTRVDKQTGKKINDTFEKLSSQKILSQVLEKLFGINQEEKLEKLLSYKVSSLSQFELLFERNGFKIGKNMSDENQCEILFNGIKIKSFSPQDLKYDHKANNVRIKQLKAILLKYQVMYSNKVFRVEDGRKKEGLFLKTKMSETGILKNIKKIEFESELQKKMKDVFGIDIVFHRKENCKPFGYSLIDHKTGQVYKGSKILKLGDLFEFTNAAIDKKLFEILKDYNIPNAEIKSNLLLYLLNHYPRAEIKDFMLFENRGRKDLDTFRKVQDEVKEYLFTLKTGIKNENLKFIKTENEKIYTIHSRYHYIGELKQLIGEKQFKILLDNGSVDTMLRGNLTVHNKSAGVKAAINDMFFTMMKSTGTAKDPFENDRKKKRKKRNKY